MCECKASKKDVALCYREIMLHVGERLVRGVCDLSAIICVTGGLLRIVPSRVLWDMKLPTTIGVIVELELKGTLWVT